MDLAGLLTFNVATGIATLVLITLGLGVIYGMMRIINLAHGEFMMLGAYTAVMANGAGVNIWIAMLVLPPLVVGAVGLILERTVIRFLYGRMMDTMLATWGISLGLIGLITTLYGNVVRGVSTPVGSFEIGRYGASLYSLVIIATALAVLTGMFLLLRMTKFGLILRATMQNPRMAAAMGVSPDRIYMATFGLGAALAGLAGGVLAPISGVSPSMGAAYISRASSPCWAAARHRHGHGPRLLGVRVHQRTGLVQDHARHRRRRPPRRRDPADPRAAAGHHRPLPEAQPMNPVDRRSTGGLPRDPLRHARPPVRGAAHPRHVRPRPGHGLCSTRLVRPEPGLHLGLWRGDVVRAAAFLGLGGYAYAVSMINMGDSTLPILIAILVPTLFAGLLGYFMFYGRISDAYIGVITLTVSVILFQLVNTTSGSQYRIGEAELGGFNGIPAIPALNKLGDAGNPLDNDGIWYAAMGALILVYALLRWVLASRFGRVVVAIRENETRAQLIGYDPRLYKLLAFMISGAVAGLAGCLYANWGGFISPTVFGLSMSAQVIIFVLVGGLGTLVGPMLGAVLIQCSSSRPVRRTWSIPISASVSSSWRSSC